MKTLTRLITAFAALSGSALFAQSLAAPGKAHYKYHKRTANYAR